MELDRWCFANETGRANPIEEAELRAALTQGKISPDTLVWRSGWKQWMPAERVRQFSKALGARAREVHDPIVDLKQKEPPPLPPSAVGVIERSPRFSTPIPAPHRQQPLVRRPPAPTISEATPMVGGGTLRPPGAVPPPPRGTPKSLLGEPEEWESTPADAASSGGPAIHWGQSQRPSQGSVRQGQSTPGLGSHGRSGPSAQASRADQRLMSVPPEELSSPQQAILDPTTAQYDPDSLDTRPSAPNWQPNTWARVQLSRNGRFAAIALGLGAISLGFGFWLTLRQPKAKLAKPVAALPTATASKPVACSPARSAQRISPSVLMSVAPIAADGSVAGRIVLGFAEGPTTAAGLTIDPEDLNVSFPFRETKEHRVVSVAPLLVDGQPSFHVLREDQALKPARAVDASRDFVFGLAESGLVRQPIGATLEGVWPVDTKVNVTDPRISSISGLAHAVTFRQGGQSGSIVLGWLTEEGRAMSGPFEVRSSVSFVGTPTVATGDSRALIAYAGRASETATWSIFLSRAALGQAPDAASAFEEPSGGGPLGDAIAPSVVALPNHRWLLQWSAGPQGQRQVRIQTLDEEGRPMGLSHTVSPVGSNSGQGLLWSMGQRAVSLFVVNIGRSAELWAAPITCPE